MSFTIIWSEFSDNQLDEIYDYIKKEASIKVAKKLLNGIINEPNKLIESPYLGQKEELLINRKNEYRYLVYKNYKLIYFIDDKNEFIKIMDVFNTSQNPIKMKRTK